MLHRLRIGILGATLAFLLLHFGMVWLHVNPFQPRENPNFWGDWYCTPFFTQGWTLFTPIPKSNYMLFTEYEHEGRTVKQEIFQSLVARHRTNRFEGLEPFIVAFANSIHFFEYGTSRKERLNGPVKGELYFSMIVHSAKRYVTNKCGCTPRNFRMILLITPTDGSPARAYYSERS